MGDEARLTSKRWRFFLDGVNEINRDYYSVFIETLRVVNGDPPIVFTSRSGEEPAIAIHIKLFVQELDDYGVKTYLEVYLREKTNRVIHIDVTQDFKALSDRGLLLEGGVGRNPYWLKMLTISGIHTKNRGGLFLSFTRELIHRKIEIKPEDRKHKPEWRSVPLDVEMRALAKIGFTMSQMQVVGFEGEENWDLAQEILQDFLKGHNETPNDILYEAEAATLLRLQYKNRIEFSHQLVQEFFAAYELFLTINDWKDLFPYCQDSWWWETIFIYGGLIAYPKIGGAVKEWEEFTRYILGDGQDLLRVLVAVGLIQSVDKPNEDISNKILDSYITFVGEGITPHQKRGVQILSQILGKTTTANAFIDLINHPEIEIQKTTITILQIIGGKRAAELLINTLYNPSLHEVVKSALITIGYPAVDTLIFALKQNKGARRKLVANTLAGINDLHVFHTVISQLTYGMSEKQ